jgi:hypothetical protein
MELSRWVKVFDRLLPRSRAWHLILDRTLKQFFEGLSLLPQTIEAHIGSILNEAFPETTTRFEDWSNQFGSPETLTAEEIDAEWGAFGGQDPRYFQDVIQSAGFDTCFIHEWWDPVLLSGDNPAARDPIALVPTSRVLVNDLTEIKKDYTFQFGDGSQFVADASVQFGAYEDYYLAPKVYPTPDEPNEYPNYFYICDEIWPQYALIPESKLRLLIRLIYKMKPVHLRCILRVTLVPDSAYADIQDTTWHDEWIQDVISGPDDLNDKI